MTKRELAKKLVKLDERRKNDLISSMIDVLFEDFYDYDFDQMDNLIEVIENISGIEELTLDLIDV